MSNVWAYIELHDGAISTLGREVLGAAITVASELGQSLTAIICGTGVTDAAAEAFDLGAESVIASDDPVFEYGRVEALGPHLVNLISDRSPSILLLGASTGGRDLAAWVGADLNAGLVSDAVALVVDGGKVKATRTVYAGKLLSTVFATTSLQIISIRSRAFPQASSVGNSGEVEWVSPSVAESEVPTKVAGFEGKGGEVSLNDASIIVSGGRGVNGPEGFEPIQELADTLGGAVGASRAAVDAGWISYDHQVGQTGKTVSPDLYIACGISGAIQHQAGMRTSKIIVAVNKDADAPIFKLAHYGIVGDLFQILPALKGEFKQRLS